MPKRRQGILANARGADSCRIEKINDTRLRNLLQIEENYISGNIATVFGADSFSYPSDIKITSNQYKHISGNKYFIEKEASAALLSGLPSRLLP